MNFSPVPKKSLGQHWLNDPAALSDIVEAADVQPTDTVLEIGPGPGSLTEILLEKAKNVIAVELDEKLAAGLKKRFAGRSLEIITQDILAFDLTSLPSDYKLVANIPYYLTSHLIRLVSESPNRPATAVLLIQKEVAERVAAAPGSMSLLSVTAQFYWDTSLGRLVPASLFMPPPKVDSQILILKRRARPLFEVDPKEFFRLVKAGFSQRRKTLLNTLSAGLQIDKETVKKFCESVDVDPGRRAQTLSLDEWHNLYISFSV
jgi:16S rRNA (adenine1518-N6/adenine1519-N6)-dimethyltransferase